MSRKLKWWLFFLSDEVSPYQGNVVYLSVFFRQSVCWSGGFVPLGWYSQTVRCLWAGSLFHLTAVLRRTVFLPREMIPTDWLSRAKTFTEICLQRLKKNNCKFFLLTVHLCNTSGVLSLVFWFMICKFDWQLLLCWCQLVLFFMLFYGIDYVITCHDLFASSCFAFLTSKCFTFYDLSDISVYQIVLKWHHWIQQVGCL